MIKDKKQKFNLGAIGIAIIGILAIILIFTFIDYMVHSLSADYAVPSYYFRNKIIFGTLISLIAYYFIRNKKPATKALIFSITVAVLLQIRYAIEGYALSFVLEFLVFHFLILLSVSYLIFRLMKI